MAKPKVPVREKNPRGVKTRWERKLRKEQMLKEMYSFRGDAVDALEHSRYVAQLYLDATKENKS
jgi:hypothetical protein